MTPKEPASMLLQRTALTALLAAVIALVAITAPAQARLTVADKLDRVQLPAPREYRIVPGWPAGVDASGGGAGTDVEQATIYTGDSTSMPAFIRAHEVCHVLVHQEFSDADRRRMTRLVGLSPDAAIEWIAGESGTGLHGSESPEEWLCDYYAMLAVNAAPSEYSSYAPAVSRARLLRIGRSLDRLRGRHNLVAYRYTDPYDESDRPTRRRNRNGTITGSSIV